MNSSGEMLEEYNYDPWGRRRNSSNWTYSNVPEPYYTDRGFTGHEHLDMFNLIHMNGRIYDPEISRFLSPDPFIQDPYNLLNYNRYTYCLNNPLKYSDPTGFIAQMEDPPEVNMQNASWLKYIPYGFYSGLYNDYEIGPTSGGSQIIEPPNKITWDKDAKVWRNSDGTIATDEQIEAARNSSGIDDQFHSTIISNLKNSLPVAITWALVGSSEGIMAGQATPAGFGLILRGPDRLNVFGFSAAGAGAGWIGADGSIASMYFFYTGDIENFSRFSLQGQSWEASVSFGEGLSAGVNIAFAQDRTGAYIIGIGISGGVGISPTFVTGQYSMILTKIWK